MEVDANKIIDHLARRIAQLEIELAAARTMMSDGATAPAVLDSPNDVN